MEQSPGETEPPAVAGAAAKGLLSLTSARMLSFGSQFVVFAILAGHLGPAGLGTYTFGVAFAHLFGTLTNFGFKHVVTREVAQRPEAEPWLVPNYLYLRALLGITAYAVLFVAVIVSGYEQSEREAALIAGALLVLTSLSAFATTLETRLKVGWVAIADVTEGAVFLVGSILLVGLDAGVTAFLWLFVGVNFLNVLIVTVVAQGLASYRWRPKPAEWWPLARMSVALGLAGVFTMIYYQVDITLLARLRPSAEVGQYGAAYRILSALNVLPTIVMVVLAPIFARSVLEGVAILQRRFNVVIHLLSLAAIPVAVVGAMAGWRALPYLPGFAEFDRGGIALAILAPAGALIFLGMVVQGLLVAAHLQNMLLRIAATGAALNLVLNLALIPVFGLYGAAATTAATETLVLLLSMRAVRRQVHVNWPYDRMMRALRAAVVLALALLAGWRLHPFLQIALGLVAYVLALLPTGALRWSDLGGLMSTSGRHADVVVPPVEPGLVPGAGVHGSLSSVGTWRSLRGVEVCRVHVDEAAPLRLLLLARLAGCKHVEIVAVDAERDRRRRRLRAQIQRHLAD